MAGLRAAGASARWRLVGVASFSRRGCDPARPYV